MPLASDLGNTQLVFLKYLCKNVPNLGAFLYFCKDIMRIIAVKTLKSYLEVYPEAEGALLSWYDEVSDSDWDSPNSLKEQFGSASIISGKRVIFNIHGNKFRLIVDIEFKFKIVFVIWFGTHKEYDDVDAKTVTYVKAN